MCVFSPTFNVPHLVGNWSPKFSEFFLSCAVKAAVVCSAFFTPHIHPFGLNTSSYQPALTIPAAYPHSLSISPTTARHPTPSLARCQTPHRPAAPSPTGPTRPAAPPGPPQNLAGPLHPKSLVASRPSAPVPTRGAAEPPGFQCGPVVGGRRVGSVRAACSDVRA